MATIDEALSIAIDHHASGRLAEAETIYGRILEADPNHAPTLHLTGVLFCQTGRCAESLNLFERAILAGGGNPAYRFDRAKALAALQDWSAVAAALRPVLALVPESADAWDLLALAMHHREDTDTAITALGRACALAPEREDSVGRLVLLLQQRAEGALARNRHAAALDDARRAIALRPDSAELRFLLATAQLDSGRFGTAVEGYGRAAALDPGDAFILHNLGIALTKAGRTEGALGMLRRAARLDPDHAGVRDALVLALEIRDPAEAALWSADALAVKQRRAASPAAPPLPAEPAGRAGRTRNVVAFSLWGTKDIYRQGALANAREVPLRYPGWTCRIYHDDSVLQPLRDELAALGAELVAMPAGSGPVQGLFWRFLAADDPTVDRFLCRDVDSRPTAREKAAVDAWIASGLPFHVMRDHVRHTDLVLAGMWGGVAGLLPPVGPAVEAVARGDADRWQDQRFLAEWLWPRIQGRVLVHDSVHPGAGLPFPSAAEGAGEPHVGAKVMQAQIVAENTADRKRILIPAEVVRLPAEPGGPVIAERPCRHGLMRFFLLDGYLGTSLGLYGEWSEAEHRVAASVLTPGDVVVEAGSNIGSHTVPLARTVGPAGLVHAFEPQRVVFDLLAHNLRANGLDNVVLHNAAVGDRPGTVGIPVPDYASPGNYGGVSVGGLDGEMVPLETIDGLNLDRLALLKADVEGMEAAALEGAARTIARCRPAIYLENDRADRSPGLIALIQGFGYRLWWHIVPLFDPANAAGSTVDAFPGIVSINMLALPRERPCPFPGLPPVTGPEQSWREAVP